jgi:transcriptional regulator with XRE-family HTH domain
VRRVTTRPSIDLKTRERIAANLRKLRWEHRYPSDAAMAADLGMSRQALNRYLKGEQVVGLDVLLLVHRKLHVPLDWLCDRDPEQEWFDPDYEGPATKGR